MKYREIRPSPQSAGLIKCYWTLEGGDDPASDVEPIVPDGCPEMVFNLNEPFRRFDGGTVEIQPKSIVVGQMKSVVKIVPTGRISLFGVRFWPFGLFPFLKCDVEQVTGRIEPVSGIFGKIGTQLEDRINSSADVAGRIEAFESIFHNELLNSLPRGREIGLALDMIDSDPSGVRINGIAQKAGVSVKQLERRFRREIGLTPKFMARLLRVQKLLAQAGDANVSGWTELCYEYGFSDQSHMIRDFKAIAGAAPRAFVRQKKPISDLFTG